MKNKAIYLFAIGCLKVIKKLPILRGNLLGGNMKDNRGELIDILVGALAGLLMFGIPAVVYVLRTGGVS